MDLGQRGVLDGSGFGQRGELELRLGQLARSVGLGLGVVVVDREELDLQLLELGVRVLEDPLKRLQLLRLGVDVFLHRGHRERRGLEAGELGLTLGVHLLELFVLLGHLRTQHVALELHRLQQPRVAAGVRLDDGRPLLVAARLLLEDRLRVVPEHERLADLGGLLLEVVGEGVGLVPGVFELPLGGGELVGDGLGRAHRADQLRFELQHLAGLLFGRLAGAGELQQCFLEVGALTAHTLIGQVQGGVAALEVAVQLAGPGVQLVDESLQSVALIGQLGGAVARVLDEVVGLPLGQLQVREELLLEPPPLDLRDVQGRALLVDVALEVFHQRSDEHQLAARVVPLDPRLLCLRPGEVDAVLRVVHDA